jgi:hypothetical protein
MTGKHQSVDFVQHFALQLRNANPEAYQAFLEAFDAYATEITVAVTDSPAAEILNMQGRAKQTLIILQKLRNPKALSTSQQQQAAP